MLDRRNYEYQNAEKAYSIGAEFEIRKTIDLLNDDSDAFGIFANLTYIYSKVTLASTSGTGTATTSDRPLQGQSPYLINMGLQFNSTNNTWNSSLLYNRIGERVALVGINDLGFPDIYERPRNQLDIQVARKILKKQGELKLTVGDLLNSPYYFYENVDGKNSFKSSVDRLFNSYKPGTTFTLGFTYDFQL